MIDCGGSSGLLFGLQTRDLVPFFLLALLARVLLFFFESTSNPGQVITKKMGKGSNSKV